MGTPDAGGTGVLFWGVGASTDLIVSNTGADCGTSVPTGRTSIGDDAFDWGGTASPCGDTGGSNDSGAFDIFSPYSFIVFSVSVFWSATGLDTPNSIGLNAISSSRISGSLSNSGFTSSFSAISFAFGCSVFSELNVMFSSYSMAPGIIASISSSSASFRLTSGASVSIFTGIGADFWATKLFCGTAAGRLIFCTSSDSSALYGTWANISRADCASASAATNRRWALFRRFFARCNFSFTASICASVLNIFDADCLVGSRPICFFCWANFERNCFNRPCNSVIESFVRNIVSRARAAAASATANRSVAARCTDASRNTPNATSASVKSSPFSYA